MAKKIKLPHSEIPAEEVHYQLPNNGKIASDSGFTFSFAAFDRKHKLFNLGSDPGKNLSISGDWFIDLLECLREVNNMTFSVLCQSSFDLHPVDWESANTSMPEGSKQCEYWQFRVNKSKGRVIGTIINRVFYIVWLDPHHNLTNSDGYGKAKRYKPAVSLYEKQEQRIVSLEEEIQTYKELLEKS